VFLYVTVRYRFGDIVYSVGAFEKYFHTGVFEYVICERNT